jgi:signal transduction histidine kinase
VGGLSGWELWFTGLVTLVLISFSRRGIARAIERRERFDRLATVARFSAQLAHDLKNPLAALKGATQFLEGELAQGRDLATQGTFLKLIGDQVERLTRVVDNYERLGRVEPVCAEEEFKQALDIPSLYNESLGTVSEGYHYDRVNGRETPSGVRPVRPWEAKKKARKKA